MIRLKLGKRIGAIALSLLLCFNLALPAFASSGQLDTVGWAETVSTFLMASGIYPYNDDEQADFSSWSADNLTALYNQFVDEVDSGVVSVEQAVTDFLDAGKSIARLTSSLVRGVVAIASGRWSVLRAFATWIVGKFDVSDNQDGLQLGAANTFSSFVRYGRSPSLLDIIGYYQTTGNYYISAGAYYTSDISIGDYTDVNIFLIPGYSAGYYRCCLIAKHSFEGYFWRQTPSGGNSIDGDFYSSSGCYVCEAISRDLQILSDKLSSNLSLPVYPSVSAGISAYLGFDSSFSGIVADTTTVSVPEALPQDSQFGGLSVQGAGQGVTIEQLQELIRDAVQDALKPSVSVTPVVVAPDVDVSADGKINADLEIDNQDVPLTSSDYSAPNLTKVFPFSIPWDIVNVLQVFNAEPVRPDFQADVYIPVVDVHVPFHIGVTDDLSEGVDNAMQLWRNMLLVLMCAGTLWLFWSQLH